MSLFGDSKYNPVKVDDLETDKTETPISTEPALLKKQEMSEQPKDETTIDPGTHWGQILLGSLIIAAIIGVAVYFDLIPVLSW